MPHPNLWTGGQAIHRGKQIIGCRSTDQAGRCSAFGVKERATRSDVGRDAGQTQRHRLEQGIGHAFGSRGQDEYVQTGKEQIRVDRASDELDTAIRRAQRSLSKGFCPRAIDQPGDNKVNRLAFVKFQERVDEEVRAFDWLDGSQGSEMDGTCSIVPTGTPAEASRLLALRWE